MCEERIKIDFFPPFCIIKLQLSRSEWGNDLPSVETHIDNHSSVHKAVEEFQMSLKDAKLSEVSASQTLSAREDNFTGSNL